LSAWQALAETTPLCASVFSSDDTNTYLLKLSLRVNKLLSVKHFEQYLAQSKQVSLLCLQGLQLRTQPTTDQKDGEDLPGGTHL
jgi:hypothetical protein